MKSAELCPLKSSMYRLGTENQWASKRRDQKHSRQKRRLRRVTPHAILRLNKIMDVATIKWKKSRAVNLIRRADLLKLQTWQVFLETMENQSIHSSCAEATQILDTYRKKSSRLTSG